MQTVIHPDIVHVHQILDEIETFYSEASIQDGERVNRLITPVFDTAFESFQTLFNVYGRLNLSVDMRRKKYKKLDLPEYDKKNIIVTFSGGKDSLAVILHYMNMGYNVYPVYVKGLKRGYPHEETIAKNLCEKLNLPLAIYKVHIAGNGYRRWIESPFNNIFIANVALSHGIRNKIGTKIAFGCFYTATLYDLDCFNIAASDCAEMWLAYEKVIKRIIPKFHIYRPLKNYQTSFNVLLKYKPELLPEFQSCLTTYRFREFFRKRTEHRFGIKMLPNRCGACWKCAVEYIWFADKGLVEYNEEYYLYCLNTVLKRDAERNDMYVENTESLWNEYFFYSINKSRCKSLHVVPNAL